MISRKIYIIIPVYNKINFTLHCLKSLQEQSYSNFEVIVIDDGSSDGTTEKINQAYPNVTVLQGDGNLWWTGATNMGVEYVLARSDKHDFILTLNNDLEVDANYLAELVKVYDSEKPCLVGSLAVHINDLERIEFLGTKWNGYTAKSRPAISNLSYNQIIQNYHSISSDVLPGRGTLIPIEVFDRIGLFDYKHFPQYLADYDFSRRAKYEGYKLLIAPKAVVKSIVESTGVSYKLNPSFKVFLTSLTSIKSPNRLITKYYYGVKHSPIKAGYIVVSFIRITLSFIRELILREKRRLSTK